MECKCGCHTSDGMTGHDGLCCSLPNVLKKNNPYKNLEKAEVYQKRINDYFGDDMQFALILGNGMQITEVKITTYEMDRY